MPSGKRPSLIPHRTIEVELPTDLIEAVDARLYDPRTGKPKYGARPALITRLLSEWVGATPLHPRVEELLNAKTSSDLNDLLATEGRI